VGPETPSKKQLATFLKDSRVRGRFINKRNKRKGKMNNKFDELTKSMAESVTRRAALKKFGVGIFGMALACFGLANSADAQNKNCKPSGSSCESDNHCCSGFCHTPFFGGHPICI
jgi:hypothetical protein